MLYETYIFNKNQMETKDNWIKSVSIKGVMSLLLILILISFLLITYPHSTDNITSSPKFDKQNSEYKLKVKREAIYNSPNSPSFITDNTGIDNSNDSSSDDDNDKTTIIVYISSIILGLVILGCVLCCCFVICVVFIYYRKYTNVKPCIGLGGDDYY